MLPISLPMVRRNVGDRSLSLGRAFLGRRGAYAGCRGCGGALAAVLLGFLVQIAERRVEIRPLRFEISILVGVRRRRLTGLVAEKPDQ